MNETYLEHIYTLMKYIYTFRKNYTKIQDELINKKSVRILKSFIFRI